MTHDAADKQGACVLESTERKQRARRCEVCERRDRAACRIESQYARERQGVLVLTSDEQHAALSSIAPANLSGESRCKMSLPFTRSPRMSFYSDHVLPHLINLAMRNRELRPYRERVISRARGRVLEIGLGSGLNLPFYGRDVEELIGLEPAARLVDMAKRNAAQAKRPLTLIAGSAESIPLDDHSIDTLVTTWTLCTIPDANRALAEMRRVLRPGGQLLFVEHGLAPDESVQRWQHRLTPAWKRIGGGCHLDRPIRALIENASFRIDRLETGYAKGPKPMTFMYEGYATAPAR